MNNIKDLVDGLYYKDTMKAYQCLKKLELESLKSMQVYSYIDNFKEMINHQNSYIRTRGLTLLVYNAKWDSKNRIDEVIDNILEHIVDDKPITSRQFIKLLPQLIQYKPQLIYVVVKALINADTSGYADSMKPLVDKDIQRALKIIKKEAHIAYCGLICTQCPIYIASQSDDMSLKKQLIKDYSTKGCQLRIEDINCLGCHSNQVSSKMCLECPMRNCEKNQRISHCGDCSNYPCQLINDYVPNESEHRCMLDIFNTK